MPKGIIVFGLNGSGKSTLGKALANALGYKYMDIEDYYFHESEVPYSKQRSREECLELILKDAKKYENFVISALKGDFNEEIESYFKLGIFMTAPHSVRTQRVRQRSIDKFGDRVKLGGDMHESEEKFLEFVKSRTQASIEKVVIAIERCAYYEND